MKTWKKNMIAAAVLVTVCTGIYMNWLYTQDQTTANLTETLDAEKVMSDDVLILDDESVYLSDFKFIKVDDYKKIPEILEFL